MRISLYGHCDIRQLNINNSMNFEIVFYFAFESYTTQEISIYKLFTIYYKKLISTQHRFFHALVCCKSKEPCIPISVKEKGGRGGGVSWMEEET